MLLWLKFMYTNLKLDAAGCIKGALLRAVIITTGNPTF